MGPVSTFYWRANIRQRRDSLLNPLCCDADRNCQMCAVPCHTLLQHGLQKCDSFIDVKFLERSEHFGVLITLSHILKYDSLYTVKHSTSIHVLNLGNI